MVVLALYFVVEGHWHPFTIVTVTAKAATANCPPLLLTARRQQVARHVVPPASEGGPIINVVELATDDSGIRRKMLMNSFFFAESTVNRLDAMANTIPHWIRKDM